MSAFGTIVVFTIAWWLSFIAVLPWGVRSQLEGGIVEEGTEPGAPMRAHMPVKIVAATIIAAVITAFVFVMLDRGWFDAWLQS